MLLPKGTATTFALLNTFFCWGAVLIAWALALVWCSSVCAQPSGAVCLLCTAAALAVGMLELWHAPSCAAPADPAVSLFSSYPGKRILNINTGGWTNPQSSLGGGNTLVACVDVQKAGVFKPLMIPQWGEASVCTSEWGWDLVEFGTYFPRSAHVVVANPLSERHLAQRASWLRVKAAEESGGFLSEPLFAAGLWPYSSSSASLIPGGNILLNVLITFQKLIS